MLRARSLLTVAALTLSASAALVPAALAAPVSLPSTPVHTERPGALGGDPAGAVAPGGEAAVVWRNRVSAYESFLSVRRRSAAGTWGAEERIGQIHPWQYSDASVAVDPAGNTTVAWTMTSEGQLPSGKTDSSTGIWAVHAPKGQPFGAPRQLGFDEYSLGNRPTITRATASGEVLVAWSEGDSAVHYIARSPGGTWGAESQVSAPGSESVTGGIRLAVSPSGRAVLGWSDRAASHSRALLAVRPAGGSFAQAQVVGVDDERTPAVQPAMADDGRAVAVTTAWGTMDTTTSTLWTLGAGASQFVAGGPLPETVEIPEAVVLGPSGAGYVVGTKWGFTDSDDQPWRFALPLTAAGQLGAPITLAAVAQVGEQLAAGFDGQGDLQLAWRIEHDRSDATYDAEIVARTLPAAGSPSAIRSIARAGSLLYVHGVAGGGARPLVLFTYGWTGLGDVFAEPLAVPVPVTTTPVPESTTPTGGGQPVPDAGGSTPPSSTTEPTPVPENPTPTTLTRAAPPAPTAAAPANSPLVGPAASPGARCVIPRLTGLSRAAATRRLTRAGCKGRVVRTVRRSGKRVVTKQSPAAGTRAPGYVVRLVVSR